MAKFITVRPTGNNDLPLTINLDSIGAYEESAAGYAIIHLLAPPKTYTLFEGLAELEELIQNARSV